VISEFRHALSGGGGAIAVPAVDWWLALWTALLFVATVAIAVGTIFLFVMARHEFRDTSHQLRIAAGAATSRQYGLVSEGMYRLTEMFMAQPDLLKYFYEEREPEDDLSEAAKVRLELICEAILDFADSVVEQKRALEGSQGMSSMDWSTWDAYFRFLYAASPRLRAFLGENIDFFPDYVLAVFGLINVRDDWTGELVSQWEVSAVTPAKDKAEIAEKETNDATWHLIDRLWPKTGDRWRWVGGPTFPWIGTWLIRRIQGEGETSEEEKSAALLAAVRLPSKHGVEIRVWTKHVDKLALQVLRSWLVGSLEGSGITKVVVAEERTGSAEDYALTYDLREHNAVGMGVFKVRAYTAEEDGRSSLTWGMFGSGRRKRRIRGG
jgi:hypothetical protein